MGGRCTLRSPPLPSGFLVLPGSPNDKEGLWLHRAGQLWAAWAAGSMWSALFPGQYTMSEAFGGPHSGPGIHTGAQMSGASQK